MSRKRKSANGQTQSAESPPLELPDAIIDRQVRVTSEAKPAGSSKTERITLSVPLAEVAEGGYISQHVECRLTDQEGLALKRLRQALINEHERVPDARVPGGRPVSYLADAVRWLLRQLDGDAR